MRLWSSVMKIQHHHRENDGGGNDDHNRTKVNPNQWNRLGRWRHRIGQHQQKHDQRHKNSYT